MRPAPTSSTTTLAFSPPARLTHPTPACRISARNPTWPNCKDAVAKAGYNGEKVVFLGATDVARISAICQVGADMLTKIGLNVDYISTDWGTVVQRMQRKQSIAEGGWSIFGLMWGGYDWYSPAGDVMLRGNGPNAWAGWPTAAEDGIAPRSMAARARHADAEGSRKRHPVAGVHRCALPAPGSLLPAGGVSERPDRHDERPDPVHRHPPRLNGSAME